MIELKVASAYIRRYRDYLGTWVTGLGVLRAIASSGGIAAWALWKEYAIVWGSIIAASQVRDALKDVFPFTKKQKAASIHTITLSSIVQCSSTHHWSGRIFSGRYSDDQIVKLRHKLLKLQHDAERNNFPDGLAVKISIFAQAEYEATQYFRVAYGVPIASGRARNGETRGVFWRFW